MTWRACSASQRAFFSIIAFLSLPHFFSSFDINCTPSSFVYEYLDSRVREDYVSSSRKSAKFSRAGWKTKVEAIYRHRWIKRSSVYVSRAGNVRPKVAYRVSRGFLHLLARWARPFPFPTRFVEGLFPLSIDNYFLRWSRNRERREKKHALHRHAVHLDEFDGVASGVNGNPRSVRHCLLLRECEISSKTERKSSTFGSIEFLIQSGSNNVHRYWGKFIFECRNDNRFDANV